MVRNNIEVDVKAASHLFRIPFNGKRYEIVFEEDDFDDEPAIDPIKTKISALDLRGGDSLAGVWTRE